MASGGKATTQRACYKCGRVGHFSRDCTTPKEQWISSVNNNQKEGEAGGEEEASNLPPKKQPGTKRPRLTAEDHLLGSEKGLQHVINTFPARFKSRSKGRGHEISDLGRFIQLYEEWNRVLFPAYNFDYFLDKVEAEMAKRFVSHTVERMRDKYVHGIDVDAHARNEGAPENEGSNANQAQPNAEERSNHHHDNQAEEGAQEGADEVPMPDDLIDDFEDEADAAAWEAFQEAQQ